MKCDGCGIDRDEMDLMSGGSLHQDRWYGRTRHWDLCSVCLDSLAQLIVQIRCLRSDEESVERSL